MNNLVTLTDIFPDNLRSIIGGLGESRLDKLEEIRLRAGKPLALNMSDGYFFAVYPGLRLTKNASEAYVVTQKDLAGTLTLVSEYSPYAFEEEIKKGFITVRGGHRVGICGKAVAENGEVKTLKNASSLNIRVSHQVIGCADGVMRYIVKNGVRHTLIVSPPRKGKTTLLRDIVRQLSDGVPKLGFCGVDVAVVDERSEIAGTFMGMPQNDIGLRTDVLDCCPKAVGMKMLLRSMSPVVVAVDEIGGKDDIQAIEEILNAGITFICTVHGSGTDDVKMKPLLAELIEKRLFKTVIVLAGDGAPGKIEGIYNEELKEMV